jgi:plasmid stabilization system protein ParE
MPSAAEDAERIYWRLVEAAPEAGQRWYNGLIRAIDSLAENPNRCAAVLALSQPGSVVRNLFYGRGRKRYRIYFDLVDGTVRILHIHHGSRREPKLRAR